MFAELIDRIVGLADERQDFKSLVLPGEKRMLVKLPDRTISEVAVPPPDGNYVAGDLDSFCEIMNELGTDSTIVFVQPCQLGGSLRVVGFCDETERRDSVTFMLSPSKALISLLAISTWVKQKTVVEAIRDYLFDCVPAGVLNQLRGLDFTRRNDGARTIEHGRESLGRSVEAAVQSKRGDLPEFIDVILPWFSTSHFEDFKAKSEVTLDMDAVNESVRLVPRGDELQLSHQRAVRFVADRIRSQLNGEGGGNSMVVIGEPGSTTKRP